MRDIFLTRWSKLYSQPTPAEQALEPAVASLGQVYRFQHPIWALGLFPDFALINQRLILEVDDPSHNAKKKRVADEARTQKLNRAGWRVVRCSNAEALTDPYAAVDRMMRDAGLPLRTRKENQ